MEFNGSYKCSSLLLYGKNIAVKSFIVQAEAGYWADLKCQNVCFQTEWGILRDCDIRKKFTVKLEKLISGSKISLSVMFAMVAQW